MDKLGAVEGAQVELTFFRGSRERLQSLVGFDGTTPDSVTITVQQPGKPDLQLEVPYGANLRDEV